MVNKRFLISVVVLFVLSMGLGFGIHGALLHGDYAGLPNLMRPESEAGDYFVHMLLAHLLMAIGFTWIYLRGKEDKPFLGQGIRFGLAVAVLSTIPIYLIYYSIQPWPGMVVVKQIVFDTVGMLLMGIVVAWLNK